MKDIYIEFKGSDIRAIPATRNTRTPSGLYSWSHPDPSAQVGDRLELWWAHRRALRTCRDGVHQGHRRRKPQALAGLLIRYRGQ